MFFLLEWMDSSGHKRGREEKPRNFSKSIIWRAKSNNDKIFAEEFVAQLCEDFENIQNAFQQKALGDFGFYITEYYNWSKCFKNQLFRIFVLHSTQRCNKRGVREVS